MGSTFSSNMRFELITTGEQEGEWGNTTNQNLGELVEQAIGGYAAIVLSDADYTLTANNGSSDEARCATLKFTGSLTATRNVICPAIEKHYIIWNATSGGQDIRFKCSGGSGPLIPAGSKALVYANGSNVVDVSILPLAVADGGTGATNATDARANIGMGTIAQQDANAVSITGGAINNTTFQNGIITDIQAIAVADGGTGATNVGDAQDNLGLVPGLDVQAYSNELAAIAALSGTGYARRTGVATWTLDTPSGGGGGGGEGTVTSVDAITDLEGLSFTGGPVTVSGSFTLSGTLGITSGGTGANSASAAATALGLGTGNTVTFANVIATAAMASASLSLSGNNNASTTALDYLDFNDTDSTPAADQLYGMIRFKSNGTTRAGLRAAAISGSGGGYLAFLTAAVGGGASETMRLTGDTLKLGTVTTTGATTTPRVLIQHNGSSTTASPGIEFYTNNAGSRYHAVFVNANGVVGSISTSGSATSYTTSSDYRLKDVIEGMYNHDAWGRLMQLKPTYYRWKADQNAEIHEGFIAHELQEVLPHAVTGVKDGEEMQSVDYSKVVPLLTAALQNAVEKINALEARLDALEGR